MHNPAITETIWVGFLSTIGITSAGILAFSTYAYLRYGAVIENLNSMPCKEASKNFPYPWFRWIGRRVIVTIQAILFISLAIIALYLIGDIVLKLQEVI